MVSGSHLLGPRSSSQRGRQHTGPEQEPLAQVWAAGPPGDPVPVTQGPLALPRFDRGRALTAGLRPCSQPGETRELSAQHSEGPRGPRPFQHCPVPGASAVTGEPYCVGCWTSTFGKLCLLKLGLMARPQSQPFLPAPRSPGRTLCRRAWFAGLSRRHILRSPWALTGSSSPSPGSSPPLVALSILLPCYGGTSAPTPPSKFSVAPPPAWPVKCEQS